MSSSLQKQSYIPPEVAARAAVDIIRKIGFQADGKNWSHDTPIEIRRRFRQPMALVARLRDQILVETAEGYGQKQIDYVAEQMTAAAAEEKQPTAKAIERQAGKQFNETRKTAVKHIDALIQIGIDIDSAVNNNDVQSLIPESPLLSAIFSLTCSKTKSKNGKTITG